MSGYTGMPIKVKKRLTVIYTKDCETDREAKNIRSMFSYFVKENELGNTRRDLEFKIEDAE